MSLRVPETAVDQAIVGRVWSGIAPIVILEWFLCGTRFTFISLVANEGPMDGSLIRGSHDVPTEFGSVG